MVQGTTSRVVPHEITEHGTRLKFTWAGGVVKVIRLVLERQRHGLSQSQLARIANVHPATLSRLEAGKLFPYPGWKRRLGKALGVPGDELFEEVNGDSVAV